MDRNPRLIEKRELTRNLKKANPLALMKEMTKLTKELMALDFNLLHQLMQREFVSLEINVRLGMMPRIDSPPEFKQPFSGEIKGFGEFIQGLKALPLEDLKNLYQTTTERITSLKRASLKVLGHFKKAARIYKKKTGDDLLSLPYLRFDYQKSGIVPKK